MSVAICDVYVKARFGAADLPDFQTLSLASLTHPLCGHSSRKPFQILLYGPNSATVLKLETLAAAEVIFSRQMLRRRDGHVGRIGLGKHLSYRRHGLLLRRLQGIPLSGNH